MTDGRSKVELATEEAGSFGPHVGGLFGEWALFGERIRADPMAAWERLLTITAISDDGADLWIADILEDLVQLDHETFAPLLEREVRTNTRMAPAFLCFVPTVPDETVDNRHLALREELERSTPREDGWAG